MKKIILELLTRYYDSIRHAWAAKLKQTHGKKLTESQIYTFVEQSLNTLMQVIESSKYDSADQYLVDIYTLFSKAGLNLLEISQVFSHGRYSILNILEKDKTYKYDPVILLGFLDEIIEQIYARYGMIYQESRMKELTRDRDRLAAKLDINQKYLKDILHTSDSAIMRVDQNEKFIEWNKGAEKIFGYTEEEMIGKTSSFLLPEGEKYLEELEYIKNEVQKNGYVKVTETERKARGGKILSVNLDVSLLPANHGEYSGRSVVIKDYTEVKQLQRQVDQSEKLAVIGKLAAGVAHEIGNPLASISSLVQILQRKTEEEFTREQLSTIKENIDRITRIVRELVDFSRPPSHKEEMIQITDIVKTALGIVKYDKRVKKVDFKTKLDPNIPPVSIVPDQLLQVFVNILINALDAVEGEGVIESSTSHDENYIYVSFSDNGIGMDDTVLSSIFDPFYTTKDVGRGTGLGLSVSYGIVKNFRGDIEVESEPGKGSMFTVKVPLYKN